MSAPEKQSSPHAPRQGRTNKGPGVRQAGVGKSVASSIDFAAVNRAALSNIRAVLARLLPAGRVVGGEYLALNPRRADVHLGSFKVRLTGVRAGCWSDFATRDHGGDLVSLVAYIEDVNQGEAARRLARMLHLEPGGGSHG